MNNCKLENPFITYGVPKLKRLKNVSTVSKVRFFPLKKSLK
jgi:hypothetical protein